MFVELLRMRGSGWSAACLWKGRWELERVSVRDVLRFEGHVIVSIPFNIT